MEKTYKILNNTEPMSLANIKKMYKGYWVYLVKAVITDDGEVISGIPVILGKKAYDGVKDGIYKQYKSDDYVKRVGVSLLTNKNFISCLNVVKGDNNG